MQKKETTTKKSFAVLFILRIIKTAVQIVVLSLSAKFFGVSVERDLWIIASSTILAIDIIIWGPINETFRTKFIYIKETSGSKEAIIKTKSLFFFTNIITIGLVFFIFIFSRNISSLIISGSPDDKIELLSTLIKIMAPSLMFNQINALVTSILNSYGVFYVPEIGGFFAAIINVVAIYFLAPFLGIYSLVVSYYVNLFVLLGLLFWYLGKENINILSLRFSFEEVKDFFQFAAPYYVPYIFSQVYTLSEKSIASFISTGSVSMIDYSRKIIDVPSGVMISTLVTILLPKLSKSYINNKQKEFNSDFFETLNLGLLFFGFLIGILSASGNILVNFLFGQGKISKYDLGIIDILLICYTFSAITNFMYYISSYALLSSKNTRFTAFWGVLPQIFMVVFNILFYKVIGIWIFPITYFVAFLIITLIYKTKYPFSIEKIEKMGTLKYIFFIIISFVIGLLIRNFLSHFIIVKNHLLDAISHGIIMTILMIVLIFILNLKESHYIRSLKKKFIV